MSASKYALAITVAGWIAPGIVTTELAPNPRTTSTSPFSLPPVNTKPLSNPPS